MWIVSDHLSSKSFIYSISYCFCLFIDLSHFALFFFFFTKISLRDISVQLLGCIFVTEFCVELWQLSTILLFLVHYHMSVPKFYGKCDFNSMPLGSLTSLSFNIACFKIRNQLLGQIIVSWQDFLYCVCQTKLSPSYFLLEQNCLIAN